MVKMEKAINTSDITFIGSGISTSFSLISFFDLVEKETNLNKKIQISIIEKYKEFNSGIPYGARSGFSPLLITSLRNFLIEPELSLFIKWLNKNKTWLLKEMEDEGGLLTKKWLRDHKEDINNNRWEDLFIPRRFFGCYINLRVNEKITELTNKNLIEVNFINDKVIDIERINNSYRIITDSGHDSFSNKVVLSVGSLPVNYLWKPKKIIQEKNLLFVNDPYKLELLNTLEIINSFISQRKNKTTNILIVGANASALELLYKINDFTKEAFNNTNFTFLSTNGRVPDSIVDEERQKEFIPKYLDELKKEKNLTAEQIANATYKDLDVADEIKLGPASTVEIISKYFGVLLESLSDEELKNFACFHGNNIGKRQRCAGLHYSNVITELTNENRFKHISGRFKTLIKNNDGYSLKYLDTDTQTEKALQNNIHIVINCVGSQTLYHEKVPKLIKNIIKKKYCTPNDSKIGFYVNDSLEASDNLHIMGPLLAGNVIENRAIWHVEHCGRIIGLSKVLSKILFQNFVKDTVYLKKDYELTVTDLERNKDINKYKLLLRKKWNNNIYYSYEHLKYFQNETNALKYFSLKINGTDEIIMPIILRNVETANSDREKISYFDAITPYGYSGPLFDSDSVTEPDIKKFWELVDGWYQKNNVITEFIRFSLNKNYLSYSGLLINTLNNVKGILFDSFEKQWNAFLPKVRNNYRRASSYDLSFEIYRRKDISEKEILLFFDIYTKTMHRHQAKAIYFFSLEYFKNLIFNNPDNFSIAFACKEGKPLSAELIIHHGKTIFAFLGGTDSDFYHYRPNDFLRVEIIKWAINNNIKEYVLGGGVKNNDGLYKHKKSLFPKTEDTIFFTGRKILNHKVYDRLCSNHVDDYASLHKEELKNYFFPLYRFRNR